MKNKDIKLIIFDMDGVLVDACEWHRISLNRALKEVCNYEISKKDHYSTYNGIPTKVKLSLLADKNLIPQNKKNIVYERKQELTVEIIKEHAKIREEKIKMIKYLKSLGIIVACYTNSIRMTAELMLEKTGILKDLDYLLTNQEVSNCKPDPEGYNFIVKKYNLEKDQVLIVEDSPKGKRAAYASGCNVLEVINPDEVCIEKIKEHI